MIHKSLLHCIFILVVFLVVARCHQPVRGSVRLLDGSPVHSTIVALNGGDFRATTNVDGLFEFSAVPAGIYVCDVQSPNHHFPQMKLKIDQESKNISVVEYKYFGAKRIPSVYPLSFVAIAPIQYTMPKPPFSIIGFVMANPMMLLMLFSFVMVFAMPKMLQGMSPEELQEIQKQSAANGDPMKNLSKLMGMPASNNDDDD